MNYDDTDDNQDNYKHVRGGWADNYNVLLRKGFKVVVQTSSVNSENYYISKLTKGDHKGLIHAKEYFVCLPGETLSCRILGYQTFLSD